MIKSSIDKIVFFTIGAITTAGAFSFIIKNEKPLIAAPKTNSDLAQGQVCEEITTQEEEENDFFFVGCGGFF